MPAQDISSFENGREEERNEALDREGLKKVDGIGERNFGGFGASGKEG